MTCSMVFKFHRPSTVLLPTASANAVESSPSCGATGPNKRSQAASGYRRSWQLARTRKGGLMISVGLKGSASLQWVGTVCSGSLGGGTTTVGSWANLAPGGAAASLLQAGCTSTGRDPRINCSSSAPDSSSLDVSMVVYAGIGGMGSSVYPMSSKCFGTSSGTVTRSSKHTISLVNTGSGAANSSSGN